MARYIARLVAATHPQAAEAPDAVKQYVGFGGSPRAHRPGRGLPGAASKLAGRPTAGFEDVRTVAAAVLNHRLILSYKARLDRMDALAIVQQLLNRPSTKPASGCRRHRPRGDDPCLSA